MTFLAKQPPRMAINSGNSLISEQTHRETDWMEYNWDVITTYQYHSKPMFKPGCSWNLLEFLMEITGIVTIQQLVTVGH